MYINTNTVSITTNKICRVKGLDQPVWFHPEYITNVLSYRILKDKYKITCDTSVEDSFNVHRPGKDNLKFISHSSGLYVLQRSNDRSNVSLVTTVEENFNNYSSREIKDSKAVRKIIEVMGFPSVMDMEKDIDNGILMNFPVTKRDIWNSIKIYGPHVGGLKGKSVRERPVRVKCEVMGIPEVIKVYHRELTLSIDLLYINKIVFFANISHNIAFTTVECLKDRSNVEISISDVNVIKLYHSRGFKLRLLILTMNLYTLKNILVTGTSYLMCPQGLNMYLLLRGRSE